LQPGALQQVPGSDGGGRLLAKAPQQRRGDLRAERLAELVDASWAGNAGYRNTIGFPSNAESGR
jgi:hypothetical protein